MLERDYIRRLIRQFFEELEKLRDKQRNDAYSSTYQCEVNSMYRAYLGHPASFFGSPVKPCVYPKIIDSL